MAGTAAELVSHLRKVQRLVMKDSEDSAFAQVFDQSRPGIRRGQDHVVEMGGVGAMPGHVGKADALALGPHGEFFLVKLPYALSALLDLISRFELGAEESGQNLGGEVAGAHIHPGVFVGLAP